MLWQTHHALYRCQWKDFRVSSIAKSRTRLHYSSKCGQDEEHLRNQGSDVPATMDARISPLCHGLSKQKLTPHALLLDDVKVTVNGGSWYRLYLLSRVFKRICYRVLAQPELLETLLLGRR